MPQIKLELHNRSYPIIVGSGITGKMVNQIKKQVKNNRLFIFYDSRFYALHGKSLNKALKSKFKMIEFVVPSGEKSKSVSELNKILDYLLSENISRSDFILACGGGVTSDLVGYAASTVLRGVRWGVVSTTLLGMVDASIGGKTGVNHKTGKNLIGAFWQPSFVICDVDYLMTLPKREILCGIGEISKYTGLIGMPMIELLKSYLSKDDIYNKKNLQNLILKSAKYKAMIVSEDERESHLRMLLNFGHTIGHAVEKYLGYGKLRHGEAVLLGLVAAVELSKIHFKQKAKSLNEYKNILISLAGNIPNYNINSDKLLMAMKTDKKRINLKQKFILLNGIGNPIIKDSIEKSKLKIAITRMLDIYYSQGVKNA